MVAHRHVVLPFDGGMTRSKTPLVRGGKGMSLVEMTELGLPVPPGFTIDSSVCRAYMEHGRLPKRLADQVHRELAKLEKTTGRRFGDPENPLLVSVRSGAKDSMPGMMDTVLNVGINPMHYPEGLNRQYGAQFTQNVITRFNEQWEAVCETFPRLGLSPLSSPDEQLFGAIKAVFLSWESERAKAYRQAYNIPEWMGTAVTVQAMVFGNCDKASCTGVVFSADVATGEEGLYGEFLPNAQGEDLVGGRRTPRPIAEFVEWNASLDTQLRAHVDRLAAHYSDVVDVEFTVESGELYILQARKAKCSPLAEVTRLVRRVWAKEVTKQEAVASVPRSRAMQLKRATFNSADVQAAEISPRLLAKGLSASPGAAVGIVARTSEAAQRLAGEGHSVIFVREDTLPSDLPGMLVASAIVTSRGGATCHAAIVARELGLPAVVGTNLIELPEEESELSVDGSTGVVIRGELSLSQPELPKEVNIFLRWAKAQRQSKPQIDFGAIERRMSANKMLNDCYLLDALARKSEGTHLEAQAHNLRDKTYQQVAGAFAAYLLLATTGEMRHYRAEATRGARRPQLKRAEKLLNGHLSSHVNRQATHKFVARRAPGMSQAQLIKLMELAVVVFRSGDWSSDCFGGDAWAMIAEALLNFLNGSLTHGLFIDAVFDLRHNGGVLFNKHPMFSDRTNERLLREQLDIKKRVSDVDELFIRLTQDELCSSEVVSLYNQLR